MMEFGKSLRAAREAKGYTVQQLAEMTRMAPTLVNDLEQENFDRIAAPIYGRGFVKLYCEAVGLAPKPLIDEYMEIVNGNREPHIRERAVPPVAETEQPAATEQPHEEEEQTPREPEPSPFAEPPAPQQDLFSAPEELPPADPSPSISRYATPFRDSRSVVSPAFWRIGVLALGAAVLLVLLILGLRALRRTTAPQAEPTASETAPAAQPKTQQTSQNDALPREQQKIPPFYID